MLFEISHRFQIKKTCYPTHNAATALDIKYYSILTTYKLQRWENPFFLKYKNIFFHFQNPVPISKWKHFRVDVCIKLLLWFPFKNIHQNLWQGILKHPHFMNTRKFICSLYLIIFCPDPYSIFHKKRPIILHTFASKTYLVFFNLY